MFKLRTIVIILVLFAAYTWQCRFFFINYDVQVNLFNVIIHNYCSSQCVIGIITIFILFDVMSNYIFYFGKMYVYRQKSVLNILGKLIFDYVYMLAFINLGILLIDIGYVLIMKGNVITTEQVRLHGLSFVIGDLWCILFIQVLLITTSLSKNKKISLLFIIMICIYVAFAPEIIPNFKKWYRGDELILLITNMKEYIKEVFRLSLLNLIMFVTLGVSMWKKDF